MKQVKKAGYLVGVLLVIALLMFVGTALVMVCMEIISSKLGLVVGEELLYGFSGNCGVALPGVILAVYAQRKGYVECVKKERFSIGKALWLGGMSVCICQLLYYPVSTLLFSNWIPMEYYVAEERTWMGYMLAIVMAPISEELLFRKGFYCMLCRKFHKVSAIVISAVCFAVPHGYEFQGFLACFVAGVVLACIYDRTGCIWYCILTHSFSNLWVSWINRCEDEGIMLWGKPLQYGVNGYTTHHAIFLVVAVVYCVVSLIVWKRCKSNRT